MAFQLSRRADDGICFRKRADCGLDLFARDGAGPQQHWQPGRVKSDHGGFQSQWRGTAIEDKIYFMLQAFGDMGRGGGADAAGRVGAGRGDRQTGLPEQGGGDGMAGHPESHGPQPGAHQLRQGRIGTARQHQCQGPGPEFVSQTQCRIGKYGVPLRFRQIGDMHDQGIETRAALGREDAGNGLAISGIRAQAVDRFGGKGDQFAVAQQFCRVRNGGGVRRCNLFDQTVHARF